MPSAGGSSPLPLLMKQGKVVLKFGTSHPGYPFHALATHFLSPGVLQCFPGLTLCKVRDKIWGVKGRFMIQSINGALKPFSSLKIPDSFYFPFKSGSVLKQLLAKSSQSNRGMSPCWLVLRPSQIRGELSWVLLFRLFPSEVVLIRSALLTIGGLKNATEKWPVKLKQNVRKCVFSSSLLINVHAASDIAGTNRKCWYPDTHVWTLKVFCCHCF